MDNEPTILEILRRHQAELNSLGISHLSVFGSMARGTAIGSSDVDVAVTLSPTSRGFARLGLLDQVRLRLSDLLARPVDVVEEPARSPRIREAIERDRKIAF